MMSHFERLLNGPINELLGEADALVVSEPNNVFLTSGVVPATLRLLPERLLMPVFHMHGPPFWIIADITENAFRDSSEHIKEFVVYKEYRDSPIEALVKALGERGFSHNRILVEKNHLMAVYYEELKSKLPNAEIVDATPYMNKMRMIKSVADVAALKKRANLTLEALHACYAETSIGDTETDIRSRVISEFLGKGFESLEFLTMTRGRADALNMKPTAARLQKGDMLRIDIGGVMDGWRSDIHRTAIAGKPNARQADCWKKNREVHFSAIETLQPGEPICNTYFRCIEEYEKHGMRCNMPFVGHSIGVGQHELPVITPFEESVYEPGMTFMIEPLGVDPDVGGFSIEDLVVVTDKGPEILSDAFGTEEMFVIDG